MQKKTNNAIGERQRCDEIVAIWQLKFHHN